MEMTKAEYMAIREGVEQRRKGQTLTESAQAAVADRQIAKRTGSVDEMMTWLDNLKE